MVPDELQPNRSHPSRLSLALIGSGLFILIQLVRWPLTSLLTVFIEPAVEILVFVCFLVALLLCLVYGIKNRRSPLRTVWLPFGICAATAIIVVLVPFNALYFKANFYFYRTRRTAIAQEIQNQRTGHLIRSGGRGDLLQLNPADRDLSSDGGEVMVDRRDGRTYILFFTFRGILDNFSGYVYSVTDDPPAADQFLGENQEIGRVAPHWYWLAST